MKKPAFLYSLLILSYFFLKKNFVEKFKIHLPSFDILDAFIFKS